MSVEPTPVARRRRSSSSSNSRTEQVLFKIALQSMMLMILWPKYIGIPLGPVKVNPALIWQIILISYFSYARFSSGMTRLSQGLKFSPGMIMGTLVGLITICELISIIVGGPYASLYLWIRTSLGIKALVITGYVLSGNYRNFRLAMRYMMISFTITFVIAIFEYLTKSSFSALILQALPMFKNDIVDGIAAVKIRNDGFRATSLYDHPIVLSIVAGISIPFFYSGFVSSREKNIKALYALGGAIALFTALFTTGSRTAVFVAATSIPSFLILSKYRGLVRLTSPAFLLIPLIFGAVSLQILPILAEMQAGRSSSEATSTAMRVSFWEKGKYYIEKAPVLGWGMGSDLPYAGTQVGKVATIDDSYLSMLLNNGMLGTVLFGALLVAAIFFAARRSASTESSTHSTYLAAIVGMILGVAIGQKGNSIPFTFGFIYLSVGMLMASYSPSFSEGRNRSARGSGTSTHSGKRGGGGRNSATPSDATVPSGSAG